VSHYKKIMSSCARGVFITGRAAHALKSNNTRASAINEAPLLFYASALAVLLVAQTKRAARDSCCGGRYPQGRGIPRDSSCDAMYVSISAHYSLLEHSSYWILDGMCLCGKDVNCLLVIGDGGRRSDSVFAMCAM
jgi:hypothetical protein